MYISPAMRRPVTERRLALFKPVERLLALHFSVDFIFLSFGIMGFIVELETIRGSLMKLKWQKLASLAQEICTL